VNLESAILAILSALPVPKVDANEVNRIERLETIATAIATATNHATCRGEFAAKECKPIASEPEQVAAELIAIANAESALRSNVGADECGPHQCDPIKIHGVVINRFKPLSREHQFRVNELSEKYGQRLLPQRFDEKSTIQQAQGAARPIHAWAGETAALVAKKFDEILDGLLIDLVENPHIEVTSRSKRKARKANKLNRSKRGKNIDALLATAQASEPLDELELLTGEIEMPASFVEGQEPTEEPTAEFVDTGSVDISDIHAVAASDLIEPSESAEFEDEKDVIPPTPQQLFEELLAETQRKLADETESKED